MKPDQLPSLLKAQICSLHNGIAVEIGTWEGDFSFELLSKCQFKKVYCVDPYKHFDDESYPDGMNSLTQADFDAKFKTVNERFKIYGDRVEFLRMTSEEASKMFQDNSIDFVYIDGNHEYKYVKKDIELWYPKVKIGGYCTGDDIYSTNLAEHEINGNVMRIWGRDANGKPNCWGQYGTYTALVDTSKTMNFSYEIDQTQFCIVKKSNANPTKQKS